MKEYSDDEVVKSELDPDYLDMMWAAMKMVVAWPFDTAIVVTFNNGKAGASLLGMHDSRGEYDTMTVNEILTILRQVVDGRGTE